jgi:formylglycine-generating enzyme required for sulfatase activity
MAKMNNKFQANPNELDAAQRVANAPTDDFAELIGLAGLDPGKHLRFADWSGLSFVGCDLRGFDFTGARLNGCRFDGALIDGARFDQAEIAGANLPAARDWDAHVRNWRRAPAASDDDHLPAGAVFQDAPFGPEMVVVPAGTFMMGSPDDEPGRFDNESPRHEVTFARPFAAGRHAVTRGQFGAFIKATGHKAEGPWLDPSFMQDDSHPVVHVSWDDAMAYAAWLAVTTGRHYRLPTEAEWEYVARAGTATPFWWGSSITPVQANYDGNHVYAGGGSIGEFRRGTVSAGSFEPNRWGLYNVHGNAWEWCVDTWHDTYDGAPADGTPWIADGSGRVVRGGAWFYLPRFLRAANRDKGPAEHGNGGFRLVRALRE